MPKLSVKKPLTVFVAVVAVLVLGVVSYLNMTPDQEKIDALNGKIMDAINGKICCPPLQSPTGVL